MASSRSAPGQDSSIATSDANLDTPDEWQTHKRTITELYWNEDMELPALKKILKDKHGFDKT
jgi:hypothetical protein